MTITIDLTKAAKTTFFAAFSWAASWPSQWRLLRLLGYEEDR